MTDQTSALPIWCTELELGQQLPPELDAPAGNGTPCRTVRVLLRLHGEPLGYVEQPLSAGSIPTTTLLVHASDAVRRRAREHQRDEDIRPEAELDLLALAPASPSCPNRVEPAEHVTVAICTRDRPEILRRCLDRVVRLEYPRLDILVVDNAPAGDGTHQAVLDFARDDARLRYVREDRPGLSCARNRALEQATGSILAFTDDDVSVDARWVDGLIRGFRRRPDVACVTGLVSTASIENVAEAYFDARVSWAGEQPAQVYDLESGQAKDALFPYSPGIFGTGANLALRTDAVRALGGFDEALGAGTATKGGEDLDIFVRILRGGWALAYEPSALVWHHHRADMDGLRAQMYGYGTGLTAFLAKLLAEHDTRAEVLRRVPVGLARMLDIGRSTTGSAPAGVRLPRGLFARELVGMVQGPYLYRKALREIPPPGPTG